MKFKVRLQELEKQDSKKEVLNEWIDDVFKALIKLGSGGTMIKAAGRVIRAGVPLSAKADDAVAAAINLLPQKLVKDIADAAIGAANKAGEAGEAVIFQTKVATGADGNPIFAANVNGSVEVLEEGTDGGGIVEQNITLNPYTLNNVSFNVIGDTQFSSYIEVVDLFLGVNGSSEFYVPSFGVNQINEIVIEDGYKLFINGGDTQEINVIGQAVSIEDSPVLLDPFTMNLISYLPQIS